MQWFAAARALLMLPKFFSLSFLSKLALYRETLKVLNGKHEFRTFYLSELSGSHSLFSGVGKAIQVKCVTLKEVLDDNGIDRVDFLKLDCEGAEYKILQTIDESALNRINMVGMEFHGHPREWFVSKLQELGFSVSQPKEDWRSRVYIIASK